jgi:putative nucleotidyltransferase with HDIG domain
MDNREIILIIDDELGPREAMRMVLKDLYTVSTASSGKEGLEYLSGNHADLVILDIKMPDMDGMSALKKIRKHHPDTEVVMVTAYASLDTARSAIRYGAHDYLMKPFDKDDVIQVVKRGLIKRAKSEKSKSEIQQLRRTKKNLEDEVENAKRNFLTCYDGAIKALIQAIDAKDSYTYKHSEHVAELSKIIAKSLGLSDDMITKIEQAALIHDIGKIGVDEQILRKEGKLADSEFDEMKKHPVIGNRIVNSVPFMEGTTQVVLYHHERFDGTGYPEGLKGSDIPLHVRIVSVADAINAMSTDRHYRKALNSDYIIKELQENAGTQFDPEIVLPIINGQIHIFGS